MASAPDESKLHELLKAAARELKATQQELADERDLHESARKALDQERQRTRELNDKLLDLQQSLRKAQTELMDLRRRELSDHTSRTVVGLTRPPLEGLEAASGQATLPPVAPKEAEDRTNVSRLDPEVLEQRVRALDQALAESEAEAKRHQQRALALEGELAALKELSRPATAELSALVEGPELRAQLDEERNRAVEAAERSAALEAELAAVRARLAGAEERASVMESELAAAREQLLVEQARSGDVLAKFAAVEAELAAVRDVAQQAAELEGQLATARARTWELEQLVSESTARAVAAETGLAEARERLQQLESELSAIRSRRDELNVELGRVESDRKKLQSRLGELEARHAEAEAQLEAKRAEAESNSQKEKEKHQITAQRLLEARQRTRDLETQLAEAQTRLQAAVQERTALEAEHQAKLEQERQAHAQACASLEASVAQLEKELAHATGEWHHTNRQYEQLHKEMLLLLDQRDEARRQLEALTGRR